LQEYENEDVIEVIKPPKTSLE